MPKEWKVERIGEATKMPQISVIMPVRNGIAFVRDAVDSILAQTFPDYELIIVDDHSTDGTRALLESYRDPRITLTSPSEHIHLTNGLNHARSLVTAPIIARMDADDVAHPERFAIQIDYLENHPDVGILGSQVRWIDAAGKKLNSTPRQHPSGNSEIAFSLLFGCPFWHPTVMIRRAVLDQLGWYGSPWIAGRERWSGEDYDLWCRAVSKTKFANLPQTLVDYRIHDINLSLHLSGRAEHCRNMILILAGFLETHLGVSESESVACALLGYSPEGYLLPFGFQGSDAFIRALPAIRQYANVNRLSPYDMRDFELKLTQVMVKTLLAQGMGVSRNLIRCAGIWPKVAALAGIASIRRLL
jgi:glycosyltransferase involved in cell wall biosynthesis